MLEDVAGSPPFQGERSSCLLCILVWQCITHKQKKHRLFHQLNPPPSCLKELCSYAGLCEVPILLHGMNEKPCPNSLGAVLKSRIMLSMWTQVLWGGHTYCINQLRMARVRPQESPTMPYWGHSSSNPNWAFIFFEVVFGLMDSGGNLKSMKTNPSTYLDLWKDFTLI